jgi:hypothetical protein
MQFQGTVLEGDRVVEKPFSCSGSRARTMSAEYLRQIAAAWPKAPAPAGASVVAPVPRRAVPSRREGPLTYVPP